MSVSIYSDFLNKKVDIAIPNFNREGCLFWITGYVIEVSENFLTLKIKGGIRKIPLSDVREISLNRGGN